MIGGVTKFGGGARDARALAAHLAKPQPGGARFVAMNSAAPDVAGAIAEARLMAAAAGIADRPFLHVHLSPSSALDPARLVQVAGIVCRELGVTDQPVGIEMHGKPRLDADGDWHAHLVIGRAGASGAVLPSGFEKIRLETAVRVAEFEVGEAHVLGRHLQSGLRHLERTGRHDVVASLRAAFGPGPAKPASAASPSKRQALDRQGIDLSVARSAVRAAWDASDGPAAFRAALSAEGLELAAGTKAGVWIVRSGEIDLGALDRLVKAKRGDVAARMEEGSHEPGTVVVARGDLPGGQEGPRGDGGASAAAVPPRGAGDGRAVPGGRAAGPPGGDPAVPAPAPSPGRGSLGPRRRDRARAAIAVRHIQRADWGGLRQVAAALRDVARPVLDRVRDQLDELRRSASDRLRLANLVPPEPERFVAARAAVAAAKAASQAAFYGNIDRERQVMAVLAVSRPSGLWGMISGQAQEWDRAAAVRDDLQAARVSALEIRTRAVDELARLERAAEPALARDRDRREWLAAKASEDLLVLDAAGTCLAENPGLARQGLAAVLREARHRLDLERRRDLRADAVYLEECASAPSFR